MRKISDAKARRLKLRIIVTPTTALQSLNLYEIQTGRDLLTPITEVLKNYPNYDGKVRIKKFIPVPHPDYEKEYGGPYSHIIHAYYCKDWGCVFGLRTDGEIVLWMD